MTRRSTLKGPQRKSLKQCPPQIPKRDHLRCLRSARWSFGISPIPHSRPCCTMQVPDPLLHLEIIPHASQIYTDTVVFAPLLSSFIAPKVDVSAMPVDSITSPLADSPTQGTIARRFSTSSGSLSRTDWIREWMKANLGRPAPCSAKSMYRVADSVYHFLSVQTSGITLFPGFELWDLKDRASAVCASVPSH